MLNLIIASLLAILLSLSTSVEAKVYKAGWKQTGVSSYYHRSLNGNKTASGERYRHNIEMTAAHRTLPFGTKVRVTDKVTGKSIVVKINDRGPFVGGRIIDLSGKAAKRLGIVDKGLAKVEIKVLSLPKEYLVRTKQDTKLNYISLQDDDIDPILVLDTRCDAPVQKTVEYEWHPLSSRKGKKEELDTIRELIDSGILVG